MESEKSKVSIGDLVDLLRRLKKCVSCKYISNYFIENCHVMIEFPHLTREKFA